MLSFTQFLEEEQKKELSKTTHDEFVKSTTEHTHTSSESGDKVATPSKLAILSLPSVKHVSHDNLKKVLGAPEHTPTGHAWHYNYKGATVSLAHNTQLGRHQLETHEKHKHLLPELRTKFVKAYDKHHPGTIDNIEKSFSAVPGKGSYK